MKRFKMKRNDMPGHVSASRDGFTLIELLISVVLSVVVMGASLSFALAVFRGTEGNRLREEVYRSARFIGMALGRDIQTTGVGIKGPETPSTWCRATSPVCRSTPSGGVRYVEHVQRHASRAPRPMGADSRFSVHDRSAERHQQPARPRGDVRTRRSLRRRFSPSYKLRIVEEGTSCIHFNKGPDDTFDLVPGDIARLQINAERRVILVTDVEAHQPGNSNARPGSSRATRWRSLSPPLPRSCATRPVSRAACCWIASALPCRSFSRSSITLSHEILYRAERLTPTGDLIGSPLAYGVKSWSANMIFLDLDEATEANPGDSDPTNDFDDILGTRIIATLGTNRPDIRVAGGGAFTRTYEWKLFPRNLMYERNR